MPSKPPNARPLPVDDFVDIPLPAQELPWATHFRSTWIVSSLEGLRECGYFERYQSHLGAHRGEILRCLAGTWLPIAAAREHYEACERLGMSDAEYTELAKVGAQVRAQWNAPVIARLKADGATPWEAMTQMHKIWRRGADGGAFGARRLSDRQAWITYVGCELFDVAYFRRAVRWMTYLMCRYKGRNVTVREQSVRQPGSVEYIVDWT